MQTRGRGHAAGARPSGSRREGRRPSCRPAGLRRRQDRCPEPGQPARGPVPLPRAGGRWGAPRGAGSPRSTSRGNGAVLRLAAALLLPPVPCPRPGPGWCPWSLGFLIRELQMTLLASRGRARSLPLHKRPVSSEHYCRCLQYSKPEYTPKAISKHLDKCRKTRHCWWAIAAFF